MVAIFAFVAITQVSIVAQAIQLSTTQKVVLQRSMPLLQRSHEFAHHMTAALDQTSRVSSALSIEELGLLQQAFKKNKMQAKRILNSIEASLTDGSGFQDLNSSLSDLSQVSTQLFETQFAQREMERLAGLRAQEILRLAGQLEELMGQLQASSTTGMRSLPAGFDVTGELNDGFLNFAGEAKAIYRLSGLVAEIATLVGSNLSNESDPSIDPAKKLRRLVHSLTHSLTLLGDTGERSMMIRHAGTLNRVALSEDGYLALKGRIAKSRQAHDQLKLDLLSTIFLVDRDVGELVSAVASSFRADIRDTNLLTRTIAWISGITCVLLAVGLVIANRSLIQKQISNRFTTLTQDVLAISNGNYAHEVRITGKDELGNIAHALDVFKKQAAELERSNLELERFAYVAAHDLKSPLDAIQDLAKWTIEDAGEELDIDSRENLKLLIKRSERLSVLQSDLLEYAQANSVNDGVATLDLGAEVGKIADLLDPANRFKIQLIGDSCEITCHSMPFRQILLNLITNAIKHHDRDEGKIAISYVGVNGMLRVAVKDDGGGIEPQFQGKIFELFKTLRSRDRVEGSGLGLALVTKLVGRFEGSVSVSSDAPKTRGTTFTFELPDMGANPQVRTAA